MSYSGVHTVLTIIIEMKYLRTLTHLLRGDDITSRTIGCFKKHESCQMKLHMEILDPFDMKMTPEFFQEF